MKIIAHISLVSNQNGNSYVYAQPSKEFQTELVPAKGMDFDDVAFKDPREIKHITINPEQGYYFIFLGEVVYPDEDAAKSALDMYQGHGWK